MADAAPLDTRPDTRPRGKKPIAVWVTAAERVEIAARAEAVGLSMSAYLRALGRGYVPPSRLDARVALDLLRVSGDLGRLGGLLKLWLTERPGQGVSEGEVRRLLEQIGELRGQLVEKVAQV
jgi:hypothetical protein